MLMPQLDVSFYYSQIFWLAVIFGCLYFLVYKFIAPLAKGSLDNRQLSIDSNITNAENLSSQSQELKQQYDNEMQKIQNLMKNIQKEEFTKIEKSFLEKKKQLNDELKAQIANNSREIEENYRSFWGDKNQLSIDLAVLLIQKITNQPVNIELLNKLYKEVF